LTNDCYLLLFIEHNEKNNLDGKVGSVYSFEALRYRYSATVLLKVKVKLGYITVHSEA